MKPGTVILTGLLLVLTAAHAEENTPAYTQSYVLRIKGEPAGGEKVTERINAAGEVEASSEHEIFVTDGLGTKRMAFVTEMLLAKDASMPRAYSCRYTSGESGDSYKVEVRGGQVERELTRNGRTSEVSVALEPGMVLVDFNVYHHYDTLVRLYDTARGGRQVFRNFVPVIGNDIPAALTLLGTENIAAGSGSMTLSSYKVEFVGIFEGLLWVDPNRRLVRLVIPAQDLEVVRKDLLK